MRLLCAVLMLAIGYLCYDIYVGRNGYEQYEQIAAQLKQAQARSTLLEQRNLAVQDELNDLKQGNAAIEELARSELGLIKEGETFYRVIGTQ